MRRIDGIKREAGGERFNSRAGSENLFKVMEEKRILYRKARKESDVEKSNVLGKKGDRQQGKYVKENENGCIRNIERLEKHIGMKVEKDDKEHRRN